MKKIIYLVMCLLLKSTLAFAQNFSTSEVAGIEAGSNSSSDPCLNKKQRAEIKTILNENVNQLKLQGKLQHLNKAGAHPLFIWPVTQAAGFDYETNWAVLEQVDHNPAFPNQVVDYDCGTRTYDTTDGNNQGLHIVPWPFYWKQMDDDQAEVIAGDGGQIIGKFDGNNDRNCAPNTEPWNAVYIQHNDGSVAWYGHLKNGSLTSKNVGDTVEQGEYLGIIGSSGNSSYPHLHFEVYDNTNQLIDPYSGPCNAMNSDSWWLDQKPYRDPSINTVLTHSARPITNDCPELEETHFKNSFTEGDPIWFVMYLRYANAGTEVTAIIRRPDNSIEYSYSNVFNGDWRTVYSWLDGGTIAVGQVIGTWSYEVTYLGQTVVHHFEVVPPLGLEDTTLTQTNVYPNPLQTTLFIESEATIVSANIRDALGRSVFEINDATNKISEIDVSFLTKGIYFITLASDENQSKTIKLIKQ